MIILNDIPKKMKAMTLIGHGGFDKLEYSETMAVPQIKNNEILIQVLACGLNNTDVNTRVGWYSKSVTGATTGDGQIADENDDGTWGGAKLKFPHIQGADVCGRVVAVMREQDRELLGKRVMIDPWIRNWDSPMDKTQCRYYGSESYGGYAEYTKVPAQQVHPIETDLSNVELASFATSYMTAENMLSRAHVKQDDVVLITGASGGVGSALIQLANRRGAKTVALAGEAKHAEIIEKLSPTVILPRNPANLSQALKQAIGHDKVDVVADIVGGDYFPTLLEAIKQCGYYTCAGAIAGPIVSLDLRSFYLNDITFTGATVTTPNIFGDIIRYIEQKDIKPLLAHQFPLKEFRKAQELFLAKKHLGNIVVTCYED